MSKTSKILMIIMMISSLIILVNSFDTQPDIYLWSWFGYEFGISFLTPLLWLKIVTISIMFYLIYDYTKTKNSVSKQ